MGGGSRSRLRWPGQDDPDALNARPGRSILVRLVVILGLFGLVMGLVLLQRDSYVDRDGGTVDVVDAFYFATVNVTTTGFGDITPVTSSARVVEGLVVTPARILFLVVLFTAAFQIAYGRLRRQYLEGRWRERLKDHFIIVGFGVKGRAAVDELLSRGVPRERIAVIDSSQLAVESAGAQGLVALMGDAARSEVLRELGLPRAQALVVAPDTDQAAVLITLTARQILSEEGKRQVTIVAAAREEENVVLLEQSGADQVITSAATAGRLLGLATEAKPVVKVLEDLHRTGVGLDIDMRPVQDDELGPTHELETDELLVGVVRGGETIKFFDPRAQQLQPGDRLLYLHRSREDDAQAQGGGGGDAMATEGGVSP